MVTLLHLEVIRLEPATASEHSENVWSQLHAAGAAQRNPVAPIT
ncbi:MAG TPA: hypothetical protein VMG59_00095 [Phycisphaerae bacterium]|nr:hypothetical protein [Phycisphaerae bacterium]